MVQVRDVETQLADVERYRTTEDEIDELVGLSLEQVRSQWRSRFGDPPQLRSAELLRHMLGWRIQAGAFGGLDRETRQGIKLASTPPTKGRLAPGTRLAREHRGVTHEVEVLEQGFRYDGKTFRSLSAIAREITGVRWNGWRFFGVAEAG